MENYWKKENPEYIDLKIKIGQIEARINSGLITNNKTLRYKAKELKSLRNQLKVTNQYLSIH